MTSIHGLRLPEDAPTFAGNKVFDFLLLAFVRLKSILKHQGLGLENLIEWVSYDVRINEQPTTFREANDRFVAQDFPA
jgi:hypothetical protein